MARAAKKTRNLICDTFIAHSEGEIVSGDESSAANIAGLVDGEIRRGWVVIIITSIIFLSLYPETSC